MFKTELATQTKVSARGYIEVRSTVWNLLPLALLIGLAPHMYERSVVVFGGLVLELLDFWSKVFFYDAQTGRHAAPKPERYKAQREAGARKLREVSYVLSLGLRHSGGAHRAAA